MTTANRANGHASTMEHARETKEHLIDAASSASETVKTLGDQIMHSAKEYQKEYKERAVKFTKEKPFAALGLSMLAGFILGIIVRK